MSLCRFGPDSDVYVFEPCHAPGHLECCGCVLRTADTGAVVLAPDAMVEHLRRHREWGHLVPDDVIERAGDPERWT